MHQVNVFEGTVTSLFYQYGKAGFTSKFSQLKKDIELNLNRNLGFWHKKKFLKAESPANY